MQESKASRGLEQIAELMAQGKGKVHLDRCVLRCAVHAVLCRAMQLMVGMGVWSGVCARHGRHVPKLRMGGSCPAPASCRPVLQQQRADCTALHCTACKLCCRVFPLEELVQAHEYVEQNHTRGKVGILIKKM